METFGEEKSKPRKTTPQKELEDKDNHKKTDIPNKVSKKFVSFVVRTSGEDTRNKIAEILRKKGIRLNRSEMEDLVDEIAAEIKGEVTE